MTISTALMVKNIKKVFINSKVYAWAKWTCFLSHKIKYFVWPYCADNIALWTSFDAKMKWLLKWFLQYRLESMCYGVWQNTKMTVCHKRQAYCNLMALIYSMNSLRAFSMDIYGNFQKLSMIQSSLL